jgi:hypothetical protein
LLAEDFRQHRLHAVPRALGSYSHRLRCWPAEPTRGNEMTVNVAQIEALDHETMNLNARRSSAVTGRHEVS